MNFHPKAAVGFSPTDCPSWTSGWEIERTDRRHQIIKGITVVSRHNPILNPFFFFTVRCTFARLLPGEEPGTLFVCTILKDQSGWWHRKGRYDYNPCIRRVISGGSQLVELSCYLLLVLSQSSSALLYVIMAVNLLVLPCLLPTHCLPY